MKTKQEVLQGMSEIEFFTRCSIDFKFFCERLLGLNEFGGIHPYQMEWFILAQNNDAVIIEAPSGFSKTEIMGVAYVIWHAIMYPRNSILLISKTIAQAKDNLLARIKAHIEDNEILLELKPKGNDAMWNVKQIRLTNNVSITNVPYSENVRSYRAHLIVCDEIDSYEKIQIFYDDVVTRLHPGGKILGFSTPVSIGRLIADLKNKSPEGYIFKRTVAIVDENGNPKKDKYEQGFSIWPEKFSIEYLMRTRDVLGDQLWQRNFMCNLLTEGEDAIFSVLSFLKCYDRKLKFNMNVNYDAQYFIGADFAISSGPKADFDAFVVLERLNDFMTVKWVETHKGMPRPAKINRLTELYEHFSTPKTTKIIADESNMGTMVISDLRSRGCTVIPQSFYSNERKQLLITLANVIESGCLIIPYYPQHEQTKKTVDNLFEQMIGFRRKQTLAKNELIESTARHDDILFSLAMAVKEAVKMKTMSCAGVSRS